MGGARGRADRQGDGAGVGIMRAAVRMSPHSSCAFGVNLTGITHFAETYAITELIHNKLLAKPILIKPGEADIR